MNLIWIVVLVLAAVAALATIVVRSLAPGRQRELGTVSPHWLAERRLSQPQDLDR